MTLGLVAVIIISADLCSADDKYFVGMQIVSEELVHKPVGLFCIRLLAYTNVPFKLCTCAYTQVMRRAHTRKLLAHINVSSKNVFAHYFLHFIPHTD